MACITYKRLNVYVHHANLKLNLWLRLLGAAHLKVIHGFHVSHQDCFELIPLYTEKYRKVRRTYLVPKSLVFYP